MLINTSKLRYPTVGSFREVLRKMWLTSSRISENFVFAFSCFVYSMPVYILIVLYLCIMLYCSFYYFFVSQLKGCMLKFLNCICFFSFVPKQIESLHTNSMFFQQKDVVVLRVLNGFQAGNCCFEPEYV